MPFFISNFKWVMFVSGLLTCTMLFGLFFPQDLLKLNFGIQLDGPLTDIIVRNWAALIGLMGIMLLYGAFTPGVRRFCLIITGVSKIVFITLMVSMGIQYMAYGVRTAIIIDLIMVILFIVYLIITWTPKEVSK